LNFVVFTYRYLSVRKNVDCTIYVHQCGLWKPERYDYKNLDIDVIPNRTHEGMKLLSCCIDNARQSPTAGIKGFSSLHMIIDSSVRTHAICAYTDKDNLPGFPYYQALNPHRLNEEVFAMAVSERLGRMAAALLQHPRVRLYQTAVFHKDTQSMNQETGWHQVPSPPLLLPPSTTITITITIIHD
jgi:hypothetical protein